MSVQDKQGQNIDAGDTVYTPYRGGKHEGQVRLPSLKMISHVWLTITVGAQVADIVTTKEEAAEKGVKNPPKARLCLKVCIHGLTEPYAGFVYRSKQQGCGT